MALDYRINWGASPTHPPNPHSHAHTTQTNHNPLNIALGIEVMLLKDKQHVMHEEWKLLLIISSPTTGLDQV